MCMYTPVKRRATSLGRHRTLQANCGGTYYGLLCDADSEPFRTTSPEIRLDPDDDSKQGSSEQPKTIFFFHSLSAITMSQPPVPESLFPTIGKIAQETDKINYGEDDLAVRTTEDDRAVQEIDSLCMKCGEEGITSLLLTSIPFFREIIVMSFHCPHCGEKNNEIQSAGIIRSVSDSVPLVLLYKSFLFS